MSMAHRASKSPYPVRDSFREIFGSTGSLIGGNSGCAVRGRPNARSKAASCRTLRDWLRRFRGVPAPAK